MIYNVIDSSRNDFQGNILRPLMKSWTEPCFSDLLLSAVLRPGISSLRGQDHFYLQKASPLKNLIVLGKLLKGHQGQDEYLRAMFKYRQ